MDSIDEEIHKEYEKIKIEKIVAESSIDNHKRKFAEMLLNGGIDKNIGINVMPQPIKKPFKMRYKEFVDRLKKVLWN